MRRGAAQQVNPGRLRAPRDTRRERGVVLVEFAFVLPLLLTLVLGIMDFGRALNYWIEQTHLSNEAARYAVVNNWPGCPVTTAGKCGDVTGTTSLQDFIKSGIKTKELTTNAKICVVASNQSSGQPVTVTVFNPSFKWFGFKFFGFSKISRITSAATMRLEVTPTHLKFDPPSCVT